MNASIKTNEPEISMPISSMIIEHQKHMPASAVKVYLYFCYRFCCEKGRPFSATITEIQVATKMRKRSVISAIKSLRERTLIVVRKEGQVKMYAASLPSGCAHDMMHPPDSGAGQIALPPAREFEAATPPTIVTTCTQLAERDPQLRPKRAALDETKIQGVFDPAATGLTGEALMLAPEAPTPRTTTVSETPMDLVAGLYRRIDKREYAILIEVFGGEAALRTRLETFRLWGKGVQDDLVLNFFINALWRFGSA